MSGAGRGSLAPPSEPAAPAKPSFQERLRRFSARVEAAKNAEAAVSPEEARRRKLLGLKRRRVEERRREAGAAAKEAAKSSVERAADVVLHCVRAHVLDWRLRKLSVAPSPVSEGISYRSWLLDVSGEGRFVVRDLQDPADALRQATGFNQDREYSFQAAAGRGGVGFLTPHHVTEEGRMILHRYHAGARRCDAEGLSSRRRQAADLIKKLHGMETTGLERFFPVNCFSDVEDLAHSARSRKLPLPENFDTLFQIAMQWRDLLGQYPVDRQREYVPCHNNLRPGKFFHQPPDGAVAASDPALREGRLYLADWESAGLGDRYWDLAQYARLNGLSNEDDALLMKYYFGTYGERQMAVLKLLRAVGDLRDGLWYTLAAALLPSHPSAPAAWPQDAVASMRRFEARALSRDFAGYIGQELCK